MTKIEWVRNQDGTQGETWNPIVGCSIISHGCKNCYAMKFAGNRLDGNPKIPHYSGTTQKSKAGPVWTGKLARAPEETLTAPLRRKKPTTYFVNSMGDLFHEDCPGEWIDQVFAVMALASQHTFQVLTKRAERMRDYCSTLGGHHERDRVSLAAKALRPAGPGFWWTLKPGGAFLPNVWLGVSAEDQERARERLPHLVNTPAAVRFVSAEPLLGPVRLQNWLTIDWQCSYCRGLFSGAYLKTCPECNAVGGWSGSHAFNGLGMPKNDVVPHQRGFGIDWVIAGGESGPGARPMHPDWARSLRDQCKAAGVPFFFKQWGEFAPEGLASEAWHVRPDGVARPDPLPNGIGRHVPDGHWRAYRVGKKAAGRLLDGIEHTDMPRSL